MDRSKRQVTAIRQPLLIFPCNGNGVEALDCLGGQFEMLGFVDDTPEKQAQTVMGHVVLSRAAFSTRHDAAVLAVPGGPRSYRQRQALIEALGIDRSRWATVVHPLAHVSPRATVGRNVLIMAGAVVTSNAVIGDHVCILPNTVVHHDTRIGNWTLVGSNVTVAGGTVVGERCYIGSGSSLMNGIRVGDGALVGMGSTVLREVAPNACVIGNPGRVLTLSSTV
jgi:sugar O-acyltransferase (sialic acid O-acetyltransferase NeuD family)